MISKCLQIRSWRPRISKFFLNHYLKHFFLTVVGQHFWNQNNISFWAIVKKKPTKFQIRFQNFICSFVSTTVFVNDYILALSSEDYFRSSFVSWPIVQREKEREKREMATTTYHSMINFCAPRPADSQQFAVNQRNTG